ncbi:MAG: glycosyltransferase family 4 protein [Acidobacteria bacterium]|nr:glycosyltransferase family 4 protein [Acidobacteriota bacterium]
MTVLHLISSGGYYGAESMLVSLARALARQGGTPIAGVFHDSRYPHVEVAEKARQQGLCVEVIPCDGRWDRRAVEWILELLRRRRVDVLHSHGYKADFYGYLASRRHACALVATCHNWPSREPSMRFYAGLDRLILRRFHRVAAVSAVVAGTLRRWGVSKVSYVPNGVPVEEFRGAAPTLRHEAPAKHRWLIGFAGRLAPEKGGEVLLHAAKRVVAAKPGAAFVFAGDGPCGAEWRKLAEDLGLSEKVTFAGRRDDMPGVYASLDLVVLPSFIEAMPICLLEALAAERPVIATPAGSVPDIIIPGETGVLVEPGNPDALAAAILTSLSDPDRSQRMACEGRRRVEQFYSDEVMAGAYRTLYVQALEEGRVSATSELASYGH